MLSCRYLVPRLLTRQLSSNSWENRIDDFTPIHIESHSNVSVRQYDWQNDSVSPKTKLTYPLTRTSISYTDRLELKCSKTEDQISAKIPIKSPLFVDCKDNAGVEIHGHEADIKIKTETGSSDLKSVKCESTSIISKKGDVQLNKIVSNCSIMTGGNITAQKIQGEALTISSSTGSVNIGSLYSPAGSIYGKHGNIKIDNVHGNCKIVTGNGSVTIGSSQDNLDVKCRGGNITVTLTDIKDVVLIESFGGPVKLYLSDVVCRKCTLSVQCTEKVDVLDEVKELVNRNDEATTVIYVNAYAPVFVGKAKEWGQSIWDKLSDDGKPKSR